MVLRDGQPIPVVVGRCRNKHGCGTHEIGEHLLFNFVGCSAHQIAASNSWEQRPIFRLPTINRERDVPDTAFEVSEEIAQLLDVECGGHLLTNSVYPPLRESEWSTEGHGGG